MSGRDDLEAAYRAAVAAVEGRVAVDRWLAAHPPSGPVWLVALGKAACAMSRGALERLGTEIVSGLVVTREGYVDPAIADMSCLQIMEAAHPVPDERSLAAGRAVIEFLDQAPADARFLFLISGGTSSLVELLPEGMDAATLAELNRRLLAAGLDIHAMNRIRKRVSRVKAGRLARWLRGRATTVLLISDVQGDDPAVIGSGLLAASPAAVASDDELPADLRELGRPAEPAPDPDDPVFDAIHGALVATNRDALAAAAQTLQVRGVSARVEEAFIEDNAEDAGRALAERLLAGGEGARLWGGEPTVVLPENPGRGGRMQALALAAAETLRGHEGICLLAAGTDGADGPTDDAGALVDGATIERGERRGLRSSVCLAAADAGRFLAASGDLLRTGPTGTNVMDVMIGWRGRDY